MTDRYLPAGWILPALDEHNHEFFTAGSLRLEHCIDCGHVQHPPQGACVACHGVATDRVDAEPVGVVVASTVVQHPLNPMLKDAVPYNVVAVELRDHPNVRLTGNVVDVASPPIGLAVVGEFTDVLGEHGIRLLQWRSTEGER